MMIESKDLKLIKKHYGEEMMHLCRRLFPILLEEETLFKTLSNSFTYSKYLYDDIKGQEYAFQKYILGKANYKINNLVDTNKTPHELLKSVGYDLYECKTQKELDYFKKYFTKDKLLCSFNDPERLDNNYVFL